MKQARQQWTKLDIADEFVSAGLLEFEVLEPPTKKTKTTNDQVTKTTNDQVTTKVTETTDDEQNTQAVTDDDSEEEEEPQIWSDPLQSSEESLRSDLPGWASWNVENFPAPSELDRAKLLECASAAKLFPTLLSNLKSRGWMSPVDIQTAVCPIAIVKRHDMVISAKTGSGKTGAFVLPILQCILTKWTKRPPQDVLEALMLLPSRELARQVSEEVVSLASGTGIKSTLLVGGISIDKQRRLLSKRPHIVVCTVGRLCDLMFEQRDQLKEAHPHLQELGHLSHIVLDEADKLMEPGKIRQVRTIFEKIDGGKRGKYQVFISSATISMSTEVAQKGKVLKVGGTALDFVPLRRKQVSVVDLSTQISETQKRTKASDMLEVALAQATRGTTQSTTKRLPKGLELAACFPPQADDKDRYLLLYLNRIFKEGVPRKVLVFCNSVDNVKRLTSLLTLIFSSDLNEVKAFSEMFEAANKPTGGEEETPELSPLEVSPEFKNSQGVQALQTLFKNKSRKEEAVIVCDDKEPGHDQPKEKVRVNRRVACSVVSLHAKKNQKVRNQTMERLRSPNFSGVCVTSDLAARGLDLPDVDVVVHLQAPRTSQLLIHRCGRTARGVDGTGKTLFIVDPTDVKSYSTTLASAGVQLSDVPVWNLRTEIGVDEYRRAGHLLDVAKRIESSHFRAKKLMSNLMWNLTTAEASELGPPEEIMNRPEMKTWEETDMPAAQRYAASLGSSIAVTRQEMRTLVRQLSQLLERGLCA